MHWLGLEGAERSMEVLFAWEPLDHLFRGCLHMLTPNDHDQEVIVDITAIDRLMGSRNPSFVRAAQEFRASIQPGDIIVEYCTSDDTWQALVGRAGYRIKRNGVLVTELITSLS